MNRTALIIVIFLFLAISNSFLLLRNSNSINKVKLRVVIKDEISDSNVRDLFKSCHGRVDNLPKKIWSMVSIAALAMNCITFSSPKVRAMEDALTTETLIKTQLISKNSIEGNALRSLDDFQEGTNIIYQKIESSPVLRAESKDTEKSKYLRSEGKENHPSESILENSRVFMAPYNIPSDDFWLPPFMVGTWDTSLRFNRVEFDRSVPLDSPQSLHSENPAGSSQSTQDAIDAIPGTKQYSILPFSDIGKDVAHVSLRFVSIDSHPREDHPFNIRHLIHAFSPSATVTQAKFNFEKAPTWLTVPSNRWQVSVAVGDDDSAEASAASGSMEVDLTTKKREIRVFAGTWETVEYIHQVLHHSSRSDSSSRSESGSRSGRALESDYAIKWRVSVPAAAKDEFVNVQDIAKAVELKGQLQIFAFPSQKSDLYIASRGKPAAVYVYDVSMRREAGTETGTEIDRETEMTGRDTAIEPGKRFPLSKSAIEKLSYPFIWRGTGPIDLEEYFGF